jgi:hypothetical protein
MPVVVALTLGILIGVALTLLVVLSRRSSVVDLGADSGAPGSAGPSPAGIAESGGPDRGTTRRIVRRIETKIGPGGALKVVVDGTTYEHLDDIPDARIRDQVRTILQTVPVDVADPRNRERVEVELREAGIDVPSAEAGSTGSADSA